MLKIVKKNCQNVGQVMFPHHWSNVSKVTGLWGRSLMSKNKSGSVTQWVTQWVSDKVTYWAVRWQLKRGNLMGNNDINWVSLIDSYPNFLAFIVCGWLTTKLSCSFKATPAEIRVECSFHTIYVFPTLDTILRLYIVAEVDSIDKAWAFTLV